VQTPREAGVIEEGVYTEKYFTHNQKGFLEHEGWFAPNGGNVPQKGKRVDILTTGWG